MIQSSAVTIATALARQELIRAFLFSRQKPVARNARKFPHRENFHFYSTRKPCIFTIEETRQRAASGRLWLIHSPAGTARAVCPCCVAHLWWLLSQLADTLRVLRLLLSQYELRIRAVIYFSVSPTQCTLWWL